MTTAQSEQVSKPHYTPMTDDEARDALGPTLETWAAPLEVEHRTGLEIVGITTPRPRYSSPRC